MKKALILVICFFSVCFIANSQSNIGAEFKYHRDVYQLGARYDNLSSLNSSFNLGLRYNFGDYDGIGFFAGYNYHARNTFKSGITAGLTLNFDFVNLGNNSEEAKKDAVFTIEANLGYLAFYGNTNRFTIWYEGHLGYSLPLNGTSTEKEEKDSGKDGPFETLRAMPGITIGYKF